MPQRTLHWPRRIARAERTPLVTGHGSFCLQRVHLGDDAFNNQRVQLRGHLLILAREGSVILDHGKHCILLREGDAVLVAPGEFRVTEIPRPGVARRVSVFYFFNARALNDVVSGREGIDEVVARIGLPALPFYPVQGLGAALGAAAMDSPTPQTDLRAVFTGLLAARPAMTLTFLKHQLFVPRFRLCLFLEKYAPTHLDARAIADHYSQGARAFRIQCSHYLTLPVNRWMFRRRIEIAHAWLRCADCSAGEVAARLGFDDLRAFKGHLKRFDRFSPLELEVLRRFGPRRTLGQSSTPSWFPSASMQAEKRRLDHLDFLYLRMTTPRESDMRALLKKYPDERHQASAATDPLFLTDKPPIETAVESLIEQQAVEVGKIVNLELIERWQHGKGGMRPEPELAQIAA